MSAHNPPKIRCNDEHVLYDPATLEKSETNVSHNDWTPTSYLSPTYLAKTYREWPSSAPTHILPNRTTLARLLFALLPSFIQARLRRDFKVEKIHPTAYLDGMRGLAAFAVFICHYSYQCYQITIAYGQAEPGEPSQNTNILQLPFIRLFYSGPPMVAIFFVVSGFALSYKPVKQIRAHAYDGLMATMSSSVFRRPLRLFLPCIASTMIIFVCVRIGLYEYTRPFYENRELLRGKWDEHAITLDTTYEQFWHWFYQFFDFVHPWSWGIFDGSTIYDRHLWTIPTEFRASMLLFLTLVMVARLRPLLRLGTFVGLIWWGLHWDRWEMALFWSGAILAELDQMRNSPSMQLPHQPEPETEVKSRKTPWANTWHFFWIFNFVVALYFLSYPDAAGDTTPGFITLTSYIPEYYTEKLRFWQSIGAVQLVWATNNHDGLKGLFTAGPVQYLGKISFALYLMHGVVLHTFGYVIMPIVWSYTGVAEPFGYNLGFVISGIFITITLIWTSDVFWRVFDIPSVKFARWLEDRCIVRA